LAVDAKARDAYLPSEGKLKDLGGENTITRGNKNKPIIAVRGFGTHDSGHKISGVKKQRVREERLGLRVERCYYPLAIKLRWGQ